MEVFGIILMLLTVLAVFIGVISLLVLIVMAISKKRLKIPGMVTGISFGAALLFFISFVILAIVDPVTDTAGSEDNLPTSSAEANPSDEDEVEIPRGKTSAEDEENTADEKTLDNKPTEDTEQHEENDLENEDLEIDNTEEVTKETEEETPKVDPDDLSNYRTDYDIKDIERNPSEYKNEHLSFEGKIIQVMEDEVFTSYRIAINDDYDRIVYLQTFSETLEERLLEDDYVTVYAVFDDLLTYETVLGANQTVPAFLAHGERIILN